MGTMKKFFPIFFAALFALPGIYIRLAGIHISPPSAVFVAGAAVMAASFILLWACDAAQADLPQALALAIVAFIAVLPEYAVDMYFTWQAGKFPEKGYAHYAIANMTGANRLIIGVAWAVIAIIAWIKTRKSVELEEERRTEILFLAMATIYAFFVTIKGSLVWYDCIVFVGIYIWYISIAGKRPCEESEVEGPAHAVISLPIIQRRTVTALMFLFSAGAILANAEPFCEGLIGTGRLLHINEFFLVQWLAPLASEMPEFVVAIMFTLSGRAGLALGSLLSSKLNQWTLLVGMIPGVFALSSGALYPPIPLDSVQMNEILLTAAQSLLAVVILVNLKLTIGQALMLFVLFVGQLLSPLLVKYLPGHALLGIESASMHEFFSVLYLLCAFVLILDYPARFRGFWRGLSVVETDAPCLEGKGGLFEKGITKEQ